MTTPSTPPFDRHDPREHFRKLLTDTLPTLREPLDRYTAAVRSNDSKEGAIAAQQLGMVVAQNCIESNRLGIAEGKEAHDITAMIFSGAVHLMAACRSDRFSTWNLSTPEAVARSRAIWDEVRRMLLAEDDARAARHAEEAEQLMHDIQKI